jgi:hypothetical protein
MALPQSEIDKWEDEFAISLQDQAFYQEAAAKEYSALIFASRVLGNEINWTKVNRAIIDRWSRSGLERIKSAAWKKLGGNRDEKS